MRNRGNIIKLIIEFIGFAILGIFCLTYITLLYNSDLKAFLEYVPHLFLVLTTFCGLSFGYASIIDKEGKLKARQASEKFFHSIIFFVFSVLPIFIILKASPRVIDTAIFGVFSSIMKLSGALFLGTSMLIAMIGLGVIFELLWERWNMDETPAMDTSLEQKTSKVFDPFETEKIELPGQINPNTPSEMELLESKKN